mgnify:CR=1 FL=1
MRHKSGGPDMTVTSFAGQQALCAWDGQTQLHRLGELDLVARPTTFLWVRLVTCRATAPAKPASK